MWKEVACHQQKKKTYKTEKVYRKNPVAIGNNYLNNQNISNVGPNWVLYHLQSDNARILGNAVIDKPKKILIDSIRIRPTLEAQEE